MDKRNLLLALLASTLIAVLVIPTIQNLPLPSGIVTLGTTSVSLVLGILAFIGYLTAEMLSKWVPLFRQLGRFAVVGVLNTIVDFAIFNLLISYASVNEGLLADVFKGMSFVVAVVNSYYWNKYWTFQVKERVKSEVFEFLVVSLVGFGLNVGVFHTVVNIIGPIGEIGPAAWANLGTLAGTLVGLAWNFLGYKLIVFKKPS